MKTTHWIFVGKDTHKFSVAHMTVFPDGKKERLHGHNYQIQVRLKLSSIAFKDLLPFREVKNAIETLCMEWKEKVLLAKECSEFKILTQNKSEIEFILCKQRYVLPADDVLFLKLDNIVVETLADEIANRLYRGLGKTLKRSKVQALEIKLTESPGQGAICRLEW